MTVLAVLRETWRELDELDDFRKYSPVVLELKRHILCAIAELEAAEAARRGAQPARQSSWPDS